MHIKLLKINSNILNSNSENSAKQTNIAKNEMFDNNLIPLAKIPTDSIKARFLSFGSNNDLNNNLKLAQEAYSYVKNLNLFSTTKKIDEDSFNQSRFADDYSLHDFNHKLMGDRIYLDKQRKGKSIDDFVRITCELAPLMHMGNCTENAILTANYLAENKKITNFALIAAFSEIEDPKGFYDSPLKYYDKKIKNNNCTADHAFVVVGLDKNAKLNNPLTWGKEAVIIDSWGDIVQPVFKDDKLNLQWLEEMKKKMGTQNDLTFTNYAPFIDCTQDKKSIYNWDNR